MALDGSGYIYTYPGWMILYFYLALLEKENWSQELPKKIPEL